MCMYVHLQLRRDRIIARIWRRDSLFRGSHLFSGRERKPVLAFVPNVAFDKIILAKQI